METEDANPPPQARTPTVEDLAALCRALNEAGAKYILIGGWAIIQHGFGRTTEDIDLLVDASADNFQRLQTALAHLPDGAIREVQPGDLDQYIVVRVCDEIIIDLMKAACGIEYVEASQFIEWKPLQGVEIPLATPELLLRLKQTYREKDAMDRQYLTELLRRK